MTGSERLVAACRRGPVDATPIWFMRQAGGSLPRYLAIRERHSVEDIARTPELSAEVSLMPVHEYGVDGAVMYADIMLPLVPMGVDVTLTATGPAIASPIRSAADIERLRPLDADADLSFVMDAIRLVRRELDGRAAVIGIVGAPFTLACYLIEGGPSRDHVVAKAFMYREPEAWSRLMRLLTSALADFARAQIRAGIDVLQVFDSWAGALGPGDYFDRVAFHTSQVLAAAEAVPTIHFVAGSAGILEHVADAGGDVIGIDSGQSLSEAWGRIGHQRAIQGNLDPARLLGGWPAIETGARAVLAQAGARPGHIFNLGHAAPRETDPGVLRELVSYVHERTRRAAEQ